MQLHKLDSASIQKKNITQMTYNDGLFLTFNESRPSHVRFRVSTVLASSTSSDKFGIEASDLRLTTVELNDKGQMKVKKDSDVVFYR